MNYVTLSPISKGNPIPYIYWHFVIFNFNVSKSIYLLVSNSSYECMYFVNNKLNLSKNLLSNLIHFEELSYLTTMF